MKSSMRITLRNGERIYINGAVLRVDRKVGLELLNDVTFLLESQVMQVEDATTPLRQLYFIVQMMLISPADTRAASELFSTHLYAIKLVTTSAEVRDGLRVIEDLVAAGRYYEGLKTIRALLPVERAVIEDGNPDLPIQAA